MTEASRETNMPSLVICFVLLGLAAVVGLVWWRQVERSAAQTRQQTAALRQMAQQGH